MRTIIIQDNRCLGGALAEEIQLHENGTVWVYLCYPPMTFLLATYVANKVRGATLAEYAPHSPTKYQNT